MNALDLFSGIGGISYALRDYVRPIAYCEIDPYCQAVLLSRMADKSLPNAPIWDDIRTFSGLPFNGIVDLIYGGFPCQDISIAGHGKGLEGERSGLFFEIKRLADEIRPKFIFLENVPAITSRGGTRVVSEIASLGYDCRWLVISAASCGAPHKRDRWFLLAHSNRKGCRKEWRQQPCGLSQEVAESSNGCKATADTRCSCHGSEKEPKRSPVQSTGFYRVWKTQPPVCLMDDGVSFRVDKLRALGNSVCPQQAKKAFEILIGVKNDSHSSR